MIITDGLVHVNSPEMIRSANEAAEQNGIILQVITSWPVKLSGGQGTYYYTSDGDSMIRKTLSEHKLLAVRFLPMFCGFNPVDPNSIPYVHEQLNGSFKWSGMGELLLREFEPSFLDPTPDVKESLYNPTMLQILNEAAASNAPALVHVDFPYHAEVKGVLNTAPNLKLIWAHGGRMAKGLFGTRGPRTIDAQAIYIEYLTEYPNLYIDMSGGGGMGDWLKMVDVIEAHPNRFIWSSDLTNYYAAHYPKKLKEAQQLGDVLRNLTYRKIMGLNLMALMGINP